MLHSIIISTKILKSLSYIIFKFCLILFLSWFRICICITKSTTNEINRG